MSEIIERLTNTYQRNKLFGILSLQMTDKNIYIQFEIQKYIYN